jgi:hypothetical protein
MRDSPRPRSSRRPAPRPNVLDNPTNKQRSLAQENKLAQKFGGSRQPGSGNNGFRPGDVLVKEKSLFEGKTTRRHSFAVTEPLLSKITEEAFRSECDPVFVITFENMPPGTRKDWALVPLHVLEKLYGD